ncbi:MAG: hemolysin family protein [Oscillospiraceae bacterium]|nr:hemolysin family protein [Oscillospiraceae bacterium]
MYIAIVVLILLSCVFAASETALSTINKIRLKKNAQEGDRKAQAVLALIEHYDKTLTTILVSTNLIAVAVSTMGTLVFIALFGASGAIVSTIVFTVLFLAGEILPKTYASKNSEKVAFKSPGFLRVAGVILFPLCFLIVKLQGAMQKPGSPEDKTPSITEEELIHFIESIEEEGVLEEQESSMVQSALEFDETSLREVITPRVSLEALDADSTQEEISKFLLEVKHSRVPVFETSIDNVIGVLQAQDAMRRIISGEEVDLRAIIQKPCFVHKGMKLSGLLSVFKSREATMAVVLDEYGGTVGIVTPTDLLEHLVGDFYDEEYSDNLKEHDDGSYEIDGGYYLEDMFEKLDIKPADPEIEYTTVNGWAMSVIGFIPEVGESFEFGGYSFKVTQVDGNKIVRLRAVPCTDNKKEQ